MKPVNIIAALTLLLLFSCDDDEPPSFKLTGVIVDESSGEPIENVEIFGFNGGASSSRFPPKHYGEAIRLGTTDKCGQFRITLSDSIKGNYVYNTTDNVVVLSLFRPDFGEKEVIIPFKPGTQTFRMEYSPIREGYFNTLYLVQSEDGKSVHIGWNIYSLDYASRCGNQQKCWYHSDGNLHIERSDSAGHDRYVIPIEVNTDQMVTDGDLPPHGNFTYASFTYMIAAGPFGGHIATIGRTNSDTLFLVRRPEFPTLNHCE